MLDEREDVVPGNAGGRPEGGRSPTGGLPPAGAPEFPPARDNSVPFPPLGMVLFAPGTEPRSAGRIYLIFAEKVFPLNIGGVPPQCRQHRVDAILPDFRFAISRLQVLGFPRLELRHENLNACKTFLLAAHRHQQGLQGIRGGRGNVRACRNLRRDGFSGVGCLFLPHAGPDSAKQCRAEYTKPGGLEVLPPKGSHAICLPANRHDEYGMLPPTQLQALYTKICLCQADFSARPILR